MKVGIITFHRASNYGAALQAYALLNIIKREGHFCNVIDYRSKYMEKYYSPFFVQSKRIKDLISMLFNSQVKFRRKRAFDAFRQEYLNLSKEYTEKNIKNANEDFDMFIFGSDQIWNYKLTNRDFNYLGEFVSCGKLCCSYAASFGMADIDEDLIPIYKSLLYKYTRVSIREASGCRLFKKIMGMDSEEVLDPVFLLEEQEWNEFYTNKEDHGKYILIYHLQGKRTNIDKYASELAKRTGLPIIDIQGWVKRYPRNVKPYFTETPCDFLGWIKSAEYIVTDSFHCTALAIIFKKRFWVRIARNEEVLGTRVGNLLGNLGLLQRIIPEDISKWDPDVPYDYDSVNFLIGKMREKSILFLKSILNSKS